MRVYVPALPAAVAALVTDGLLAAPLTAYAVTDDLVRWVDDASDEASDDHVDERTDDEQHEYVAAGEAARHCLRLLAADPDALRCRVVLAADVPDGSVEAVVDGWPGEVRLGAPVGRTQVVSVHVDEPAAAVAVAAACAAVGAADAGDGSAEEVVEAAESAELLWYAAAELELLAREPRFAG